MKNSLCKDCSDNNRLKSEWSWYEIQHSMMCMHWVRYVVTVVMAGNTVYLIRKGIDFGSVVQIVGMAFSCIVMWRSFNRLDMKHRVDRSRQKMFVMKLEGR